MVPCIGIDGLGVEIFSGASCDSIDPIFGSDRDSRHGGKSFEKREGIMPEKGHRKWWICKSMKHQCMIAAFSWPLTP